VGGETNTKQTTAEKRLSVNTEYRNYRFSWRIRKTMTMIGATVGNVNVGNRKNA